MSVKDTARKQYVQIVNRAARQFESLKKPSEGWLSVLRNALGMSGADVAARAGVSRNAVYQAERNERDGAISLPTSCLKKFTGIRRLPGRAALIFRPTMNGATPTLPPFGLRMPEK